LTDAEFSLAKQGMLTRTGPAEGTADESRIQLQLNQLQTQAALDREDKLWELERQQYLIWGKYGQRYIPSRALAVLIGVGSGSVGLIFIYFILSLKSLSRINGVAGSGSIWTGNLGNIGFGILMVCLGIGFGLFQYTRAVQYEKAEKDHWRRLSQAATARPKPTQPSATEAS